MPTAKPVMISAQPSHCSPSAHAMRVSIAHRRVEGSERRRSGHDLQTGHVVVEDLPSVALVAVRRSRALLVVTVGASSLWLGGCTVEIGGTVGLTMTGAGEVAAVLVACQGYLDGVTVYQDEDGPNVGEWEAKTRITDVATIVLTEGPAEAATDQLGLDPGATNLIYGWTKDNRWSAGHEAFTAADVRALRVNEVWFTAWDRHDETYESVYVPIEDFPDIACAEF